MMTLTAITTISILLCKLKKKRKDSPNNESTGLIVGQVPSVLNERMQSSNLMNKNFDVNIEPLPIITTDQIPLQQKSFMDAKNDQTTPLFSEPTEEETVMEDAKKFVEKREINTQKELSKENKWKLNSERTQRSKMELSEENKRNFLDIDNTQRSITQKLTNAKMKKNGIMTEKKIVKLKQRENFAIGLATESSQASSLDSARSWSKNENDKTEIKTMREIPPNRLLSLKKDTIKPERSKSELNHSNISFTGDERAQSSGSDSEETKSESFAMKKYSKRLSIPYIPINFRERFFIRSVTFLSSNFNFIPTA
ncbi:hypothetical protein ACH3XW_10650 [Acanthocheilonema viteae]